MKKNIIIAAAILAATSAGVYFYFIRSSGPTFDYVIAERSELVQEVSVTGRVKPAESVELAFEKTGRISSASRAVGDKVKRGDILVSLENQEIAADLLKAEADLEAEAAKLSELRRGTRPEEIQVQEVKVENAKIALEDTRRNLIDKIQDAFTKSDDAVRSKTDQFISNPRSANPQITFTSSDPQLEIDVESGRINAEVILNSWASLLVDVGVPKDLEFHLGKTGTNLSGIKSFLDKVALLINGLKSASGLTQATIDGYRADVTTARNNLNTAIQNLSAADEKFRSAASALILEENQLALKKAGASPEEILQQEARLKSSEANLRNIQAQMSKTFLLSPIDGVVTRQDAKRGEIVAANTALVSVISEDEFEIEANIPEADIAKVKTGQIARVTLDAYGSGDIFEAEVVAIDPAETVVEGVSTYKTTLRFTNEDARIRSGMTANLDILTAKLEGVIAIPQRAVITRGGEKFVRVLEGDTQREIKVETGLGGSEGNIEIKSGIGEGALVITSFE